MKRAKNEMDRHRIPWIRFKKTSERKILKRATRLKYKRKNINKDWCFPSGPFSRTKL